MTWRCLLSLVVLAPGCASTLEKVNRATFAFNDAVDRVLVRPVVTVYECALPPPLRTSLHNVFANLTYPGVILNDLLQGKFAQAGADTARLLINTTVGVGGLVDPATEWGLSAHDEDFGQTLGVWGIPSGPYLVLPILGPSTFRDAWMHPVATATNPLTYAAPSTAATTLRVLFAVDQRSAASGALRLRDESALDRYTFTREAYLQHRAFLVRDGRSEPSTQEEEFQDLLDELD